MQNILDIDTEVKTSTAFYLPYREVIQKVQIRLESFDASYKLQNRKSPIHSIRTRLKTLRSISEKLRRKQLEDSLESAAENLTDIAGVRVICYSLADIRTISQRLKTQKDFLLIAERDYITHPKPSGYRSYHMVLGVPVYLSNEKLYYPVELQIRTLSMDLWASVEHRLIYKAEQPEDALCDNLRQYAEVLKEMENRLEPFFHAEYTESEEDACCMLPRADKNAGFMKN